MRIFTSFVSLEAEVILDMNELVIGSVLCMNVMVIESFCKSKSSAVACLHFQYVGCVYKGVPT